MRCVLTTDYHFGCINRDDSSTCGFYGAAGWGVRTLMLPVKRNRTGHLFNRFFIFMDWQYFSSRR